MIFTQKSPYVYTYIYIYTHVDLLKKIPLKLPKKTINHQGYRHGQQILLAMAQNYQPPKWMVFLLNMIISVGHWYHRLEPNPPRSSGGITTPGFSLTRCPRCPWSSRCSASRKAWSSGGGQGSTRVMS